MALTKITTSVVAVNSLTAANIADNTIDATKIAQNQILARHIANATALTLDGGVTVDEITIDADTITATDDFIIDATTNIFLDADGGEVVLRDGGSNFGYFHQDSNNFEILSTRSDGDIIIKGNDGGSTITALTLDMSDAGSATFNSTVTATKLVSTNGILELDDNGSHNGIINVPASITINIDSDDGATNESFSIAKDKTAINDTDVLFRVQEDGKVGIGTTSPDKPLHIYSADNQPVRIESSDAYAGLQLKDNTSNASPPLISALGDTLLFYTHNGSSYGERIRILDGGGIAFNGDTAAANALADYEEGTWTPVIYGHITDPSYTASTAVGDYVKIGSVVHANFLIVITAVSNVGNGNKVVSGLPFAQNQSSYQQVGLIGYNDVWTDAVTRMYMTGQNLAIMPDGVTQANYTGDVTTGYFAGQITYTTNS